MQSMLPPPPHEDTHLLANAKTPMRYAHIDVLKGAGILLVVLLHSFPPAPEAVNDIPPSLLDPHSFAHKVFGWLGWVVPGFFACSGLLYAKDMTLAAMNRRLIRLLPAYICASVTALVLLSLLRGPIPVQDWLSKLLFGNAVGVFYFVPMLVVFTVATPALGRLPPRLLPCLLALAITLHVGHQVQELKQFQVTKTVAWTSHNPIDWTGYFVLGWLSPLLPHASPQQGILILVAVWLLRSVMLQIKWGRDPVASLICSIVWNYAVILCAPILLPPGRAWALPFGRQLQWISANSYTIFLHHMFFAIVPSRIATHRESPLLYVTGGLTAWTFSMACTCGIALFAPRLLGPAVSGAVFGCVGDEGARKSPAAAEASQDVKAAV